MFINFVQGSVPSPVMIIFDVSVLEISFSLKVLMNCSCSRCSFGAYMLTRKKIVSSIWSLAIMYLPCESISTVDSCNVEFGFTSMLTPFECSDP